MHDRPTAFMHGSKTFVRYVSFKIDNECVIVDLGTMDLYTEENNNLILNNNQTFNKIKISNITIDPKGIKDLIKVFKSDSDGYYRSVTLDNRMTFYCIRLPKVKNNPTFVYLDTKLFLEWNDKYTEFGGTYYNKQKLYKIDSFLE